MKTIVALNSLILIMSTLISCSTIPKGVVAVSPFNKEEYLGKWYEIARFDFRFERNLNNTTAEYSTNPDGSIKVVNRGYNTVKNVPAQAEGKAKFASDENKAMLKVSFFGPFYAGYNVIALDEEYRYALVCGSNFDYLWILSRDTTVPDDIKNKYLKIAEDYGFNVSNLLWIEHNNNNK